MSGYDPVSTRVRLTLLRLHRGSVRGTPVTMAFSALCATLRVPAELHARLLQKLVDEGYVTEVALGQVRLTEAGIALATSSPPDHD
jgi:DNA-binding IclR family transcriptional regulator